MSREFKKILLLTLEYPPARGGVSRYYGEIVKRWPDQLEVVADKSKMFWWLWPKWLPALWRFNKKIRKEGIELLWVGQALPLGYAAWWLNETLGLPYIVFTHGMDILAPQKSWWKKMWLKRILRAAELVVANSEFTKRALVELGVAGDKIIVVYPCPSLDKEQGAKSPAPEQVRYGAGKEQASEKIILSVGRLVKRKGFNKVIEIMPRLLKRIPNLKYIIIGDGPELNNLELGIRNYELGSAVSILTEVDDSELVQWYQRASVFVMPCEQLDGDVEGFGMVFLEAASYGLPVVVGRSGGAPETVHHGYGGFVIDPDSEDELYQALLKILTDDNFAARMGKYGQEWVKKNFQWDNEIDKLTEKIRNT